MNQLGSGPPFDRFLPVSFTWFADGLWVTVVDERFAEALATRVVRIGERTVDEAMAAVCTTFARENEAWPRVKAPPKLQQPALLHALGVTRDAGAIPLRLALPDGEEVAVTVDGGSGKGLFAPDPAEVAYPLWLRRRNETYWFEPLEGERAVYFAYNRCAEDPQRPMDGFAAEVLAALARPGIERLVIDLRHNSGGNSAILARFIPAFAGAVPAGGLRVLIGPRTYSSGMRNAQELRAAGARLFGQPTGGKPSSYGEVRSFALPRSGLAVYHSTRSFRVPGEDAPSVEPDVLVDPTSADFFAGEDPVLARALAP